MNTLDGKISENKTQAQPQAQAYAQAMDIHLEAGQEKHPPQEAWHVVQQRQGRVKPKKQIKGKKTANDDEGLENEADEIGSQAINGIQKLFQKPTNNK